MSLKNHFISVLFIILSSFSVFAQSEEYKTKKAKQLAEVSLFQDEIDSKNSDLILYEDKYIVAFKSNSPQLPVHVLIVPRKRIATLNDLSAKDEKIVGKMIIVAKDLAKKLGIAETGYRLAFNTNEDAGQSVFHVHLHLLGGHTTGPMVDQKWRKQQKEENAFTNLNEVKHGIIEQYIQTFKDSTHFQGTVLVAKGDSLIHHAAYGMFDVEHNIPNKLNTQFLIGSLTKSFVATAILQLVEKKQIELNAPIQQYLPKLKAELAEGVTVHHLLKQQSGLPVYIDDLTQVEVMDITPNELLDIINKGKKEFKAGEKHEYSNINFCLLAMIIENASGMTYEKYLQENILKPAKMNATGVENLMNVSENRAIGYRTVNGIFRPIQNVVSYAFGSGDIYSTASDLLNWSKALRNGTLISKESFALMTDGGNKDWGYYGYGMRIQPYQQKPTEKSLGTLIRHGGTMNGYISNYHYYKEDDLTIIVLGNYRNIPIRAMSFHLKEISLGVEIGKRSVLLE
jgi:CubicO group peptidase (beta-lactamase class C family)/diadenosine tetraphosphate (Ap4A) HIT family hydrolase